MQVLVTGGAGFIGSHVVDYHLARGDRVTVVDDLSTGSRSNLAHCAGDARLHVEVADVVTWRGLDAAVAAADRIYHLAALVGMFRVLAHPVEVMRVNIAATERVLEAAARSGRRPAVVLASSSSVYGCAAAGAMREDAPVTLSPHSPLLSYEISKFGNEEQGRAYARAHGLPVVAIRFFNIVGPRQAGAYGFVLPRFVQQAVAGEPLTVFGDGVQTRSFCDVRDAVAMIAALAGTPAAAGLVVNVGDAREIGIGALAELVRRRAGSASPIGQVSYAQAYGREFEPVRGRCPDLSRLHGLIAVRPEWTLEATIDDLLHHQRQTAGHAVRSAGQRSAA